MAIVAMVVYFLKRRRDQKDEDDNGFVKVSSRGWMSYLNPFNQRRDPDGDEFDRIL